MMRMMRKRNMMMMRRRTKRMTSAHPGFIHDVEGNIPTLSLFIGPAIMYFYPGKCPFGGQPYEHHEAYQTTSFRTSTPRVGLTVTSGRSWIVQNTVPLISALRINVSSAPWQP
eukprot:9419018-Pyramimonas_sp.AAC.1